MSETRKTWEGGLFFVTMTVVGWIDVFNRREYIEELIKNIKFCQEKKGLELYCYCIMSSHVHMIAAAKQDKLSYILRDLKSYTAQRIFELIENNPQESRKEWMQYLFRYFGKPLGQERQFWQHGNYPVDLFLRYVIIQKAEYIHCNPVKAGIENEPEHYIYSSAPTP